MKRLLPHLPIENPPCRWRWLTCLGAACYIALASHAYAEETLDQRRERVEAMSPVEKAQLRQRWERYKRLSPADKEKIAKLHATIEADPQRAELRQAMHGYADWLSKQEPYVRARLAGLDAKQRAAEVQKLTANSSEADRRAAAAWLERYVAKNEARWLESLSDEWRQQVLKTSQEQRTEWFMRALLDRWRRGGPAAARTPPVVEADLDPLRSELSPEGRRALEGKAAKDQFELVLDWVRAEQRGRGRRGFVPPGVDDEQLVEYFEKLPDKDRERLLGLSGDDMQVELRRMYYMSRMRPPGAPHNADAPGSGHGRGPGPPRFDGPRPGDRRGDRPPSGSPGGPLGGPPPVPAPPDEDAPPDPASR